ncbi:MAG: ATPase, T2SS/T4P/T4SS family [Thermaerobacter sp.]|nr:ATPase, T2SS/T4P/T4SS family [Thermaerobacter sp.]
MIKDPTTSRNVLRDGTVANPWERRERQAAAHETPRGSGESASSPITQGSVLDRALTFMQDHDAALLSDPLSIDAARIRAAIQRAVLSLNLRRFEAEALTEQLADRLVGPGALGPHFRDPAVTEIMVVGGSVYVERDGRIQPAPSLGGVEEGIRIAQHLCRHEGREYKSSDPLMNFTWHDDGSRINIVHHSKSATGVAISIRKRQQGRRLLLPDLIEARSLSQAAADLLVRALTGRLNLILAGPQGAGKTEMLRAIALAAIPPDERTLSIEDMPELDLQLPHLVALIGQTDRTTPDEKARGAVSQEDHFRNTLRMRPDRLIFGELRGPEALAFFEALLSSQGGSLTTMHLYTPELLADRLYQISHKYQMSMPYDLIQRMVYGTVAIIVQLERDGMGHRHVSNIVEVEREGAMRDLFRWDPQAQVLASIAPLSEARQAWIAAHTRVPGGLTTQPDAEPRGLREEDQNSDD